jgi:transcriptional regulator with XRE-family HTH domain
MKSQLPVRRRALAIAILDSGFTQGQIAHEARIETSRMSRIVRGTITPHVQECTALARVLRRHPEELFPEVTRHADAQ